MFRFYAITFFLLFYFLSPLSAQNSVVAFEDLSLDSDLAYDQIEHILIDSDGFTWIATSTGLHKFDGYDYETFLHNANDSTSISENFSSIVFEDSQGKIWVGTYNNGLNVYDKASQSFYNYRYHPQDVHSLSTNKIARARQAITEDKEGYIWVNTENGLNRIDPKTKLVERFFGELNGHILYDKNLHAIWIANQTLTCFDIRSKQIKPLNQLNFPFQQIHSLLQDEQGFLWLGTNQGLFILKPKSNQLFNLDEHLQEKKLTPSNSLNWSKQAIKSLYKDFKNHLWIATKKAVYILDNTKAQVETLSHNPESKNGLLNEDIRGLYGNQAGMVFITYEGRGITKVNTNVKQFKLIQTSSDKNSIFGTNIRSILKDTQERLWIGTYSHGLNCIDFKNNQALSHYQHDPTNAQSINSNYITAIYVDRGNRLWIGTFEDGFCYADLAKQNLPTKFTRSKLNKKVEIHEFTEDPHGRIWISTNQGFYIYDKTQEALFHYGNAEHQLATLKDINIQSVVFEAPNIFWLATWNKGIAKLIIHSDSLLSSTIKSDKLIIYEQNENLAEVTIDNRLITMMKDKAGNFWLGSNVNGLIKMTPKGNKATFIKYDRTRGAPSNSIYGIVEDEKGNIWVSSKQGIGKFIPKNEQFINFYESDGLQSNIFIWDAYYQNTDGEIFFGGINGLNSFYPDSITYDNKAPSAFFKKLIINHQDIRIGEKVNGRVLLSQNIRYTQELALTHKESIFSIEFAALHSNNPDEIQFEYMLENFDQDWIHTSSDNRTATYTNLARGTYYFKVRATRNYGIWQEPTILKITVLPPWWKTHWAYGLYGLIALLLLYFFKIELSKRIKLKHHLDLEQYKHEKDNELNQEKFQFFTNLSHELRTPLTLILGPLERMIRKNETDGRTHQNLLLIQKQAQKLQKLTNQLLKFRKYDVKNIKLQTAEGNISKFLQEIEIAFRQHAKIKEIHFKLSLSKEQIPLFWDRDKLEIVLVNLLSNAFKFTPPQGQVHIKCKEISRKEHKKKLLVLQSHEITIFGELPPNDQKLVEIELSDTGCGISKEQLKHIFDRYFQAGNIQHLSIGGTGIGLEITKNYVELHQGSIAVHSQVEKGTTFYIWLPKGNQHLEKEEIISGFKSSEHKDHYTLTEKDGQAQYPEVIFGEELPEVFNEDLSSLLVVDDNPDILHFLKESFQGQYNLITAVNGKDALNKAFEVIPDLVISDIMMPVMDGLELCHQLKSDIRTSHIPVILLTARTSTVFQAEGLETGADDYITKPFDERILNIRVKNLVASRKALRERYQKELVLKPKDIAITQPDEKFLDKLIEIIEENMSDSNFKVERITKEIGMSHSVLYKKILALTGLTIVEFIRTIRLKKAALILSKSDMRIGQVSYEVGFTDPKYFSKCFQKQFGLTPTQYSKTHHMASS